MTLDTSEFEGACRFVIAATGKEAAPLVNKYLLQTIIGAKGIEGAMQRTPKADKSKIAAITDRQIRAAIARRLRKSGKLKSTSGSEFQAMCDTEKKRILAASGYTAFIGWTPAAKAFGGTGPVGAGKPQANNYTKYEAGKGTGQKATVSRLVAEAINTAPQIEEIGVEALQESLDAQSEDMVAYGTQKLQDVFTKVAGRIV